MSKNSLSVAIATYSGDDFDVIKKCINSTYSWVDEIVVVYGSPEDETVKSIKKFDKNKIINVIITDNPKIFHINKQKAIDNCSSDWILQLDADEVVSDSLKKEIIEKINNNPNENGFWIPRLNYFLGQPLTKGGQYPDPTIRLYRRGKGHLPCKSVHEQAEISGKVGTLKHDLLHYPWETIEDYFNKALVRYSMLEAIKLQNQGVVPSIWNGIKYFKIMPIMWFFKTYFRHRGYVDGYPGFLFSLFSSIRYWIIYAKLIETRKKNNNK